MHKKFLDLYVLTIFVICESTNHCSASNIAASKITDTGCRSLGSECPLSIAWRRFVSSISANVFQLSITAFESLRLLFTIPMMHPSRFSSKCEQKKITCQKFMYSLWPENLCATLSLRWRASSRLARLLCYRRCVLYRIVDVSPKAFAIWVEGFSNRLPLTIVHRFLCC